MKTLAVIPARSGSKRIPNKNMTHVGGKPMIRWTIDAAREAEHIDYVVVSTDDWLIAEYAQKSGAAIHLRDKSLAEDHVPAWKAVVDVLPSGLHLDLETGEGKPAKYADAEALVMLLPTCPLRTAQDIDVALTYWKKRDTGCSLISVTELHTAALVKETASGWLGSYPLGTHFRDGKWEQPYRVAFSNGAIQVTSVESVRLVADGKNPFRLPKTLPWWMPWDRGIDVDTEDQLRLVDRLVS